MRAILTYHSLDGSGSPISVGVDAFDAQVRWLAARHTPVMSLADAASGSGPDDAVAVTFDDGFANFKSAAWPRLRDRGVPVTLFVVTDHAGGTNAWRGKSTPGIPTLPLLDWDDIGRLAEEGVDIGAHTRTHPSLAMHSPTHLADEVAGSVEAIASRIGRRPRAFAYPYGITTPHTDVIARAVEHACTTELRVLGDGEDAFLLPRLDMYYFRGPGQLETWGTPAFSRRLGLRRALRRLRELLNP